MNRIREVRKEKKLSQQELAEQIGITQPALSNYENGSRKPSLKVYQFLANYFNTSVAYLKGYMICTRCKGYFIPENNTLREQIECCPYCMNPYFEGDK